MSGAAYITIWKTPLYAGLLFRPPILSGMGMRMVHSSRIMWFCIIIPKTVQVSMGDLLSSGIKTIIPPLFAVVKRWEYIRKSPAGFLQDF